MLGIEAKAPAGRLRPEHALFLERIRAAGGVAFVARNGRDVLRELQSASIGRKTSNGRIMGLGGWISLEVRRPGHRPYPTHRFFPRTQTLIKR